MYKTTFKTRKNGVTYEHVIVTEYYAEDDGRELTKEEYKKEYSKLEETNNKYTTNLTKYYGYKYIKIETDKTIVGRRKPKQLQLF